MTSAEPSLPPVEMLLQRVRTNEPKAWEQLLSRSQPLLDAWASQYTQRSAPGGIRASDVSQEAALSAFKRFTSFRGLSEGEWNAWLRQVVESHWADLCRHATRLKRDDGGTLPLDADEVQDIPAVQHTPSQLSSQKEQGRLLLGHVLTLPEDQREALALLLLRGASRKELMARSTRSPEALESLLRRGMRTLAARMEGREDTPPREPREVLLHNQVDAALSLYFRRLEEGVPVELESFAAEHPECADELLRRLRWLEALRALQLAA